MKIIMCLFSLLLFSWPLLLYVPLMPGVSYDHTMLRGKTPSPASLTSPPHVPLQRKANIS